jgi:hypothetical protein
MVKGINCCGICYDVGGKFIEPFKSDRTKCQCGNEISGQGIHWAGASRFRKATDEEVEAYYNKKKNSNVKIMDYTITEEYIEFVKELEGTLEEIIN